MSSNTRVPGCGTIHFIASYDSAMAVGLSDARLSPRLSIRPSPTHLTPSTCVRAALVDTNITAKLRFLLQQKFRNVVPVRIAPLFWPSRDPSVVGSAPGGGSDAGGEGRGVGRRPAGSAAAVSGVGGGHGDLSRSFHCGQRFRFISLSA